MASQTSRRNILKTAGVVTAAGLAGSLPVSGNRGETSDDRQGGDSDAIEESPQIVIFRDDDIQPDFGFDRMVALHDIFREEEIPLSIGVIPEGINEDERLLTYLNDLDPDLFEICTHGYNHESEFEDRTTEFRGVSRVTQREKIANGTALLESCTDQSPTTFIPPWNSHDETTAETLREEGYDLLSSSAFQNEEYYGEGQLFVEDDLIYLGTDIDFVADWGADEIELVSQEEMRAAFDLAREEGRVHVPMLHFNTVDSPDDREKVRSFIQYVDDHNVRYMTFREFAEGYHSGKIQQTGGRWTVVENGEE